jgi:hypothetical protein
VNNYEIMDLPFSGSGRIRSNEGAHVKSGLKT